MSHLLVCFNSSTNFLIYYLNGEKFRRAWVETYGGWCCCCRQQQNKAQTTTINIPVAIPEIQLEMSCKVASGSSGSSEPVETEAIKSLNPGPSAVGHRNRHSSFQNSYKYTQCETVH